MKYTPQYFDFAAITHKAEVAEMLLMVVAVYAVIFVFSWLYTKFQ